jgi:Cys-rich repeat protein
MKTTTSWGLVLSALFAVGCTSQGGPTLARPNTQLMKSQSRDSLGGNGLTASAQFDAPVVDANAQSNVTPGSGSFTVAPSTSGGPGSLGVVDQSPSGTYRYVIVGDLNGNPPSFFAVIADVPFTVGVHAIDNVHFFAGLFDTVTGDPTHLATGGSVTFTTTGGVGGRWVGSFAGTLDAVSAPQCQTSSDCAAGEVCSNGTCVRAPPPQCTVDADCAAGQQCHAGVCVPRTTPACVTSSDCAAGQQCQAGVCVPSTTPACVTNSDCGAGQVCVSGQCVTSTPSCRADADCAANEQCVRGTCTPAQPQCSTNAQCPVGWVCQAGQCAPGTVTSQCEGQQGDGAVSGQVTTVASCAALPAAAVSLAQGVAIIDDQLRLVVFDGTTGDEGVSLELAVCPGAVGTLTLGNGLLAASHVKDVQTPDLRLFAERRASSASLTLTRVSPTLAGSFSLTLAAGGAVSGSFTMY